MILSSVLILQTRKQTREELDFHEMLMLHEVLEQLGCLGLAQFFQKAEHRVSLALTPSSHLPFN